MTPGGMSRDLGGHGGRHSSPTTNTTTSKGKKATTLFLQQTLVGRIARKLPPSLRHPRALNVRRLGRKPFRFEYHLFNECFCESKYH